MFFCKIEKKSPTKTPTQKLVIPGQHLENIALAIRRVSLATLAYMGLKQSGGKGNCFYVPKLPIHSQCVRLYKPTAG